jgi:hypothetical protein
MQSGRRNETGDGFHVGAAWEDIGRKHPLVSAQVVS